jgi:hypothetical protein
MLVYRLPATAAIYGRFGGVSGSAYFIGGFGMTALTSNDVVLVPIRSGLGLRRERCVHRDAGVDGGSDRDGDGDGRKRPLGANVGYLKFTPQSTWNPS